MNNLNERIIGHGLFVMENFFSLFNLIWLLKLLKFMIKIYDPLILLKINNI